LFQFLQIYHKITNSQPPQQQKENPKTPKKNFEKLTINLINEFRGEARLDMVGVTF
jgi:hypothetical protein